MGFEKHFNKTYNEVLATFPGYVEWAVRTAATGWAALLLRRFATWAEAMPSTFNANQSSSSSAGPVRTEAEEEDKAAGTDLMGFRRHRDKTYKEVLTMFPGYVERVKLTATRGRARFLLRRFAIWANGQIRSSFSRTETAPFNVN